MYDAYHFYADAARVDFRNPENFQHDVNSVAGLLKTFFRDLPDPLLTQAHYAELIDAARKLTSFSAASYSCIAPPG